MRKLKPDRGIQGLIPAIVSIVFFCLIFIFFDLRVAFTALGLLILSYSLVFGFWSFYKTGNYYLLISAFYLLSLGGVMLLIKVPETLNSPAPVFPDELKVVLVFFYLMMFWLLYGFITKRFNYRGREVLELAAWDVEEGPESYTERPRPAGVVDYSKYDIIDFTNHLKRIMIGMTYQEENRVLIVPIKHGHEWGALYNPNFNYLEKTWIAFNFDGQVSVHISRKDYLDYKEDLAFDHLCDSLGKLFITFADFYMRSDKVRILDRLNSVKLGLFS
ncbi:hypothetical protein SLH46_19430 [Draconibacterium sp. IB214405]|uniref:hypothetical protein n=1 Tax=Draconibacterium sp. IB214405 TaxID=3097352 RepID=UPI002A129C22|nr:hypothetical protein [Draconibacterium sp. IB214405]MDX8341380.1 hypothetical protein [Draconibacterium sp. IB214405]